MRVSHSVRKRAFHGRERLEDLLAAEGAALGRYVLGRSVTARACESYARAAGALGYDGRDAATRWALRRPWSLGALDAALAVARPDALLRKKIVLMAAILETQPEYADEFLPRADAGGRDAMRAALAIVRTAVLLPLGFALLLVAR